MDVQVQVAGQITSKPTSNGGQKFDIPLSNGSKPSTFDAALATKISQFGSAVFTARLEQKGKYTNIIAAAGPGETLPPEIPQAGTPIGQPQAVPFQPVVGGATPIVAAEPSKKFGEADVVRIAKLAALGTAYGAVSSLFHGHGPEAMEQLVEFADALAKKLYLDARSHEPEALPQQQVVQQIAAALPDVPVAAEPQAVAAFVAEQAGAPVVQVGVEGVAPAAAPAALPWSQ